MAYAFVQSNGNANDASAASIVQAFGSNVVSGQLLVLAILWHSGTVTITSITDSVSTSYASAVSLASGGQTLAIWYGLAGGSGANTATVNFSAAVTERRLAVHEYSGNAASAPLDNTNSASGSSTTPDSGAQTPSVNGCLICGAVVDTSGGDTTITAGTAPDFTKRQDLIGGGGFLRMASEENIQTTAASISADWTLGISHDWLAVMAIFKPLVTTTDDILIRYGSISATAGSGLITAAFASTAPATTIGGGYYLWYYQNVVEDLV